MCLSSLKATLGLWPEDGVRVAGQDITILIADDDSEHREMWSLYLSYEGYQVETATNGREVLELTAEKRVDLLLLDVNMPLLDGFEVLQELRQHVSPEELPVIMVTARDGTGDIVRGFELGVNDYVTKPLNPNVLMARIRRQLRSRLTATLPEPADPLVVGEILEERYRVEEKIGEGGIGSVYRATHLGLDRSVALKLVATVDSGATARLRREGISVCRLEHANAVEVLDFFVTACDSPVLVMELLEGHSLAVEIEKEGPLALERCVEILLPVCSVLSASHSQGIIHRDVKPQNVFLHHSRGQEIVKMLDFGLAKINDDLRLRQALTIEGSLIGTPAYMAPERFTEAPQLDASDIYSFGVMFYEMLAGRRPFLSETLQGLVRMHLVEEPPPLDRPDLPTTVASLVMATLSKEPADRPRAGELAEILATVT